MAISNRTLKTLKNIEAEASTGNLTRKQIEAAIQSITDTLKGPGVSSGERLALNAERHGLRAQLAAKIGT